MFGYVLEALILAAVLWWLYKVGEAYIPGLGRFRLPRVRGGKVGQGKRRSRSGRCPVCGMPEALALQVKEGKRHCPHVGWGKCPYDPRRGLYRLRR